MFDMSTIFYKVLVRDGASVYWAHSALRAYHRPGTQTRTVSGVSLRSVLELTK